MMESLLHKKAKNKGKNVKMKMVSGVMMLLLLASIMTVGSVAIRPAMAVETLKVGVIGPYNLPQWYKELGGMEGGALLAMLDGLGSINIGGQEYQIELVFADEHAYPLNPPFAYDAAMDLCEAGCRFIIGGFNLWTTWEIIRAIKDWNDYTGEKVIYFINGAFEDELISQTVGVDYEGYKWLFRINPVNSTTVMANLMSYLRYLIGQELLPIFGTVRIGFMVEDGPWASRIPLLVQYMLPNLFPPGQVEFSYGGITPPGTTEFWPYLESAMGSGIHLLVTAYKSFDSIYLVSQWSDLERPFMLVGIDLIGQCSYFSAFTDGACEYEILVDFSGTRTPITPLAIPFWDHFVGNFSAWPLYTAFGAYNAFIVLKQALETAGTLYPDYVISILEGQETPVLNGIVKFTSTHDLYSISYGPYWPDGYIRAMTVQWINKGGTVGWVKDVIWPLDQLYSRYTVFPPWISSYDLNGDSIVDFRDLLIAWLAFGSQPGDPRWNSRADLNGDYRVDMADITKIYLRIGGEQQNIAIVDLDVSRQNFYQGCGTKVSVTIANYGSTETEVDLSISFNSFLTSLRKAVTLSKANSKPLH